MTREQLTIAGIKLESTLNLFPNSYISGKFTVNIWAAVHVSNVNFLQGSIVNKVRKNLYFYFLNTIFIGHDMLGDNLKYFVVCNGVDWVLVSNGRIEMNLGR